MSPMSLLTMSSDTLQAASLRAARSSPHGERGERAYALALVLMLMAVPLSLLFMQ